MFSLLAPRIGLDACLGFHLSDQQAIGVAVIACVGQDVLGTQPVKQRGSQRRITALAGCDDQTQQSAVFVDGRVQLGGQSATGSAQATPGIGVVFFSSRRRRPVEAVG